jgi:hypothetical protein
MTAFRSPLTHCYHNGRECCGFVLKGGPLGFEAISRDEVSLGMFETAARAATAF